jgi:hypothetical protein
MKAPMSRYIRKLISRGDAATKIVDAVLEERAIPGSQAIRIASGNKITFYKPVGQLSSNRSKNHQLQDIK